MRVTSHYENVVDQLDYEHDEGLHEANIEGQNWSFELPRVIQRELHILEALLKLCLYIDVEYETTNKASDHDRCAHWLHIEVE